MKGLVQGHVHPESLQLFVVSEQEVRTRLEGIVGRVWNGEGPELGRGKLGRILG